MCSQCVNVEKNTLKDRIEEKNGKYWTLSINGASGLEKLAALGLNCYITLYTCGS